MRKKEEKLIREKGRLEDKLEKIKNKISEIAGEGGNVWEGCDIIELDQDVVDTFVEKVVVWDEKEVEIEWRFKGNSVL